MILSKHIIIWFNIKNLFFSKCLFFNFSSSLFNSLKLLFLTNFAITKLLSPIKRFFFMSWSLSLHSPLSQIINLYYLLIFRSLFCMIFRSRRSWKMVHNIDIAFRKFSLSITSLWRSLLSLESVVTSWIPNRSSHWML